MNQTRRTLLEKQRQAHKWYTHMAKQKQDNQLEHTYSSYVRIQDVALKICQRRWTIWKRGKRESGISVLAAQHDDDEAETLLHSLEQAVAGIGLHVNAHKTEFMCFNQTGDISTLDGSSLKLVDKFTYLGSSVSSTEKDIDTQLMKAWTAINHMEVRPDR